MKKVFDKYGHPVHGMFSSMASNKTIIQIGVFRFFPYRDEIYFVMDIWEAKDEKGAYMDLDSSRGRLSGARDLNIVNQDLIKCINGTVIKYNNNKVVKVGNLTIVYNISDPNIPYGYISLISSGSTTWKYDYKASEDSRGYYIYRKTGSSVLGPSSDGVMVVSK